VGISAKDLARALAKFLSVPVLVVLAFVVVLPATGLGVIVFDSNVGLATLLVDEIGAFVSTTALLWVLLVVMLLASRGVATSWLSASAVNALVK
jgi:hypothetical protein